MPSTFSPNKSYELQQTGENPNTWGIILDNQLSIIDLNFGGRLSKDVAGASNVTLTTAEARNVVHILTGLLTGNIDYIVPNAGSFYYIYNNTTGNFSVTVKPSGGAGIVVPRGARAILFSNPTSAAMEDFVGLMSGGAWQAEATVTSAATCDIFAATSNYILITGNTGPITSLGTARNKIRWVRFDNTPTLTYNATSLILPGNANIVAAAGDTMLVVSDNSGNARVLFYQRRANPPVTGYTLGSRRIFNSSDTWNRPVGCRAVLVEMVGGGGGGGGVLFSAGQGTGGGGGAAEYAQKWITSPGTTETVTIGAAGSGGASGANPGGSGGTTSFGSHVSAGGGSGGTNGATSTTATICAGGAGGIAGTGSDYRVPGQAGGGGGAIQGARLLTNAGGCCVWGNGGVPPAAGGNGVAATGRGGGGSGGVSVGSNQAGGDGTPGRVIVWEYY